MNATTTTHDDDVDQQRNVMKRLPSGGVGILRGCRYMPAASFLAPDGRENRMRAVILIAAAALGLAACGKTDQAGNTANVDETLTADTPPRTTSPRSTRSPAKMRTWPPTSTSSTKATSTRRIFQQRLVGSASLATPQGLRAKRRLRRRLPQIQQRPQPTRRLSESLGQPDDLVRLQRQAPFGPLHRQRNRRIDRRLALLAVHRLDEEVIEVPVLELRPDRFRPAATPI